MKVKRYWKKVWSRYRYCVRFSDLFGGSHTCGLAELSREDKKWYLDMLFDNEDVSVDNEDEGNEFKTLKEAKAFAEDLIKKALG